MSCIRNFTKAYGYGRGDHSGASLIKVSSYIPGVSILPGIFLTVGLCYGGVRKNDAAFLSRGIINLTGCGFLLIPVDLFATILRACIKKNKNSSDITSSDSTSSTKQYGHTKTSFTTSSTSSSLTISTKVSRVDSFDRLNNQKEIANLLENLEEKANPNVTNDLKALRVEAEKTFSWEEYLKLMKKNNRDLFFNIINNLLIANDQNALDDLIALMTESELLDFAEDYSDIEFACKDNKKLPMNKALLSAYIPYFKSMFQWGGAEQNGKEIDLPDVSIKSFKKLIAAEVFKKVLIDETNFQKLFELADRFDCSEIKKRVAHWFLKNYKNVVASKELSDWAKDYNLEEVLLKYILIDEKNFKIVLQLADKINLEKIKKNVAAWVLENIDDFKELKDMNHLFKLAANCNAKDLKKILFEKLLFINRKWEYEELHLIKKWANHLEVDMFPQKISPKELRLKNFYQLLHLFPEDVYSHEFINYNKMGETPFNYLLSLQIKNKVEKEKFNQLLIKWAPYARRVTISVKRLRILLPHFNNLETLYIIDHKRTDLNDSDIRLLPKSLTALGIFGKNEISERGYEHLPTSLTSLIVQYCSSMTDRTLACLSKSLEELKIKRAPLLTGTGISSLGPNIKLLSFTKCENLHTIRGLNAPIKTLILAHCNIRDIVIPSTVTYLYLVGNNQFTGKGIQFPQNLEYLNVSRCKRLIKLESLDLNRNLKELYSDKKANYKLQSKLPQCKIY